MEIKKATSEELNSFLSEYKNVKKQKKKNKEQRIDLKERKRIDCLKRQKKKRKKEEDCEKDLSRLLLDTPLKCPNVMCQCHSQPQNDKWFLLKGTFVRKWSDKLIQRFQCKMCGSLFSSGTFTDEYRQQKPYLNSKISKLANENKSQRQIAKELKVTRKTIAIKMRELT